MILMMTDDFFLVIDQRVFAHFLVNYQLLIARRGAHVFHHELRRFAPVPRVDAE